MLTHGLSPTSSSTAYQPLRVFHQIQEWLGQNFQYGWEMADGKFTPTTTDVDIAPIDVLKKLNCGCRTDFKSKDCSCTHFGVPCTES